MSLAPLTLVYIFRSLFVLRECVLMSVTSTTETFFTAKFSKRVYKYHKIGKAFPTFYHRHSELIVKYSFGLKNYSVTGHIRASILW